TPPVGTMVAVVNVVGSVIKQHLIDPEICIRCNTCEAVCPIDAITHDDRNYVVKVDVCNGCMACVPPCPNGAIDNWHMVPAARAYPIEEQLEWDSLPLELTPDQLEGEVAGAVADALAAEAPSSELMTTESVAEPGTKPFNSARYGATVP